MIHQLLNYAFLHGIRMESQLFFENLGQLLRLQLADNHAVPLQKRRFFTSGFVCVTFIPFSKMTSLAVETTFGSIKCRSPYFRSAEDLNYFFKRSSFEQHRERNRNAATYLERAHATQSEMGNKKNEDKKKNGRIRQKGDFSYDRINDVAQISKLIEAQQNGSICSSV